MLESSIQNAIRKKLVKSGWTVIKLFNNPGWPDLLAFKIYGKVLFIEVKQPGKKPDPLQLLIHEKLQKLGFTVIVADSVKDITDEILKSS